MDDPGLVRGLERQRDLAPDPQHAADRELAGAIDLVIERATVEVLHDDVRRAVRKLADVDRLGDVRVTDRGSGARFVEEPSERFAIARELAVETLDRDAATELDVLGSVDGSHATFADELGDHVPAVEYLAGEAEPILKSHLHQRLTTRALLR